VQTAKNKRVGVEAESKSREAVLDSGCGVNGRS
jgi:hypothetical protein